MLRMESNILTTSQILHQGYPKETLERFLKARDGNVCKANKMLLDTLNWRVENDIDNILARPIEPIEVYTSVRDSQLIGLSGYCKQGRPVFALGVGLSAYDKASADEYVQSHIQMNEYRDRVLLPMMSQKFGTYIGPCLKVLDMTGLKLSALSRIKILTMISTVDDLNYPEKTEIYYIVNAPHIFSACWKVVKPLLQERTRRKIQVLQGSGRDELLKVMSYDSLPHFVKQQGSSSSRRNEGKISSCFSFDHSFHQEVYAYMKNQADTGKPNGFISKLNSFHVQVPDETHEENLEGSNVIVRTIKNTLKGMGDEETALENGVAELHVSNDQLNQS
ncbi:SEC14-like protein 4 isoform X2 [Amborella trichopoda]|uniref:SEC14-like protein 4 isoform X2 n=1 Tax=Amborella trichopoda TaxID=13333 RepID=UPI0005D419FF|nr:SEC14-like protein 4 isoform X2 [Amborella trichopoda]|eukprot:XP_011625351.1 SEC14-like protein 4 isoform X2 [Amborella trichopoda]